MDTRKFAMNYGAVLGLFLVAIAVIMWLVGADDKQSVIPSLLKNGITIAFIAYAIIQYRDINNNGFITYSESLKLGTTVAFFSSIILAFYQVIHISYLDPNALSEIMKITEQAMLESNPEISDEELDMALQMTGKFMQPHWMMIMGMLGGTFMGFLYSLIISFFTKKYKVSDLDQEVTVKNVKRRRYVLAVITCFVICITLVIFQNKDTNYESRKNTDSESKKDCDTNCKSEAEAYVKKLCKESGSWDATSFDLYGWTGAEKVGNKEYAVEIHYPNLEGGPHTGEVVVRVDCECNIVSSRKRKN